MITRADRQVESVLDDPPSLPLITIGITCYNAAGTIARAINSGRAQNWPDLEIIVVDDGSRDDSVKLVEHLRNEDSRIKLYVHPENRGCAAARNTILREALGDFVAFFDDDDESLPARLKTQFERIVNYEKEVGAALVACYASGVRYYPNGYEISIDAIGSKPEVPIGEVLADYVLSFDRKSGVFYGAGTPTCALMARKDVFRLLSGFDDMFRRMEDVEFATRLAFKGGHFIGTQERLFTQFASKGSDKNPEVQHRSFRALLQKNRVYLEKKGVYSYCLYWAELRYWHFARRPWQAARVLLSLLRRYPMRTAQHFAISASRRFLHERKMNA